MTKFAMETDDILTTQPKEAPMLKSHMKTMHITSFGIKGIIHLNSFHMAK
jgi:hypothetical protein